MTRLLTIAFCLFLSQPIYAQSESSHSQGRVVLEQLAKYWDGMDPVKKQKWIEITNRYPNMTPLEQQRIQEDILNLDTLTPKQRKEARNIYQQIKNMPLEKKIEIKKKWKKFKDSKFLKKNLK
jgi:SpoVK/Ycf46/Vps4 family AAA+-type ATPase